SPPPPPPLCMSFSFKGMSYDISGSALSFLLFFHELERIPQTLNLNTAGFKKKAAGFEFKHGGL
ncbi:hypothetical protein, partial [Bacteroides pyogenes]